MRVVCGGESENCGDGKRSIGGGGEGGVVVVVEVDVEVGGGVVARVVPRMVAGVEGDDIEL